MVVRLHLLATLVRSTAMNVHRCLQPTLTLSRTLSSTSNKQFDSSLATTFSKHQKRNSAGNLRRDVQQMERVQRETRRTASSSLTSDALNKNRTDGSSHASLRMIGSRSEPQIQRLRYIRRLCNEHSLSCKGKSGTTTPVNDALSVFFGNQYRQFPPGN